MKISRRIAKFAVVAAVLAVFVGTTAESCSTEYDEREAQQAQKKDATKNSLEKQNLAKKIKLEEDSERVGYVYLVTFGKPIGFYSIKGKVSSSGSQLTPENDIVRPYTGEYVVVDGPQDDGTYGEGDPGIFFFTTEGAFVHTSMDYLYSTQPLPTALDVPKLNKK